MSLEVRRAAGPGEVEAAGEIAAEAYRADRLVAPEDPYLTELADARRRAAEGILLVAVLEPGAVVGTITLAPYGTSYAETAEPGELELRMLAVAPEARRCGVAEALVRASVREALLLGHRSLVLSTAESMRAAHRLYERLGWRRAPERDWQHEEVHVRVYRWRAPEPPGAAVERATWPPLRTERLGAFELGMSGGITRRACSASLVGPVADLGRELAAVEAAYVLAGLVPCVRVEASGPPELAAALAARGWRGSGETLVMVRDLEEVPEPAVGVEVSSAPDAAWLHLWSGDRALDGDAGRRLLTGVPAAYLSVRRDGEVLGVIRVCTVEGWAGLSCLTVREDARGQGLARALLRAALHQGRADGASRAFSQVLAHKPGPVALHEELGFVVADAYRYAEPPAPDA